MATAGTFSLEMKPLMEFQIRQLSERINEQSEMIADLQHALNASRKQYEQLATQLANTKAELKRVEDKLNDIEEGLHSNGG